MFDLETIRLLSALPSVQNLNGETARASLTQAYLDLTRLRVSGSTDIQDLPKSLEDIRQMANSLELFCLIEFAREGQLLQSGRAAAFVAAQSLELLSDLPRREDVQNSRHVLADPQILSLVESGLLYLIAGYYANAATNVKRLSIPRFVENPTNYFETRQNVASNVLGLLTGLIGLNLNATEQYNAFWPNNLTGGFSRSPSDLSASAEGQLLSQIGFAIKDYLNYLAGGSDTFSQTALTRVSNLVSRISQVMQSDSVIQLPAESLLPYHLASLLEIVFRDLTSFSTVHNGPSPSDANQDYQSSVVRWLRAKAKRKYALLWHSTRKWLDTKRTKDATHTVVSMPTGSGKSFLAELALVERLHKGWGLYLAPMNALVRQVQFDLERELTEIGVKKVHRFLIDEHTTLEEEIFTGAGTKEIVIMTPEKALLAIRLKPEAFKTCSVCIFDECHLLAKENRGAASDDLLARLVVHAPDVHIMLMSAMVQNPDKLANWLHQVTGKTSRPIHLNWKPTRSLRTLALVSEDQVKNIPEGEARQCDIQLIGQASIAWQKNGASLYVNSALSSAARIQGKDERIRWDKSVNDAARQIGVALVQQHIPTLVFLNTNATHVWTHGKKITNLNWKPDFMSEKEENLQERVKAWLKLAETELDSLSPIRKYHQNGVTVHSGALIDEERRAAELAYKNGLVGLMIATGTLAQGLNLPSQAVIMAGIEGSRFVGERSAADILNALGRSGRAGFYNIGLSILVPRSVLLNIDQSSVDAQASEYTQLLRTEDACLDVTSALKNKVDKLIAAAKELDTEDKMHPDDLETATLIMGTNTEHHQGSFFKYSYAAHSAQSETYIEEGVEAAQKLITFFTLSSPCPNWMPELAQRAGLSIAWLSQMHQVIETSVPLDHFLIPSEGFQDSLQIFQEVIKNIPPVVMVDKFGGVRSEDDVTKLAKLPKNLRGREFDWSIDSNNSAFNPAAWKGQWDTVFDLLKAWVNGDSFKRIAAEFFELELPRQSSFHLTEFLTEFSRSDRSPLHKAIKNIKNISYPLRHVSGGFVLLITKMMFEKNLIQAEEDVPLSVGMLPQAIHWGIDRLDKAFWYYNLLPVRCVAHACAEMFPIRYETDAQIKAAIIQEASKIRANPTSLLMNRDVSNGQKEIISAINVLLKP